MHATHTGGMPRLTELYLAYNSLSDESVLPFAAALEAGCAPQLEQLNL